jgi:group I intron endonuclease
MFIYKATNVITGKSYIGQTINSISNRISQHKRGYRRGVSYFYNAIRKYGWNSFEWSVLCECDTKEELDEMEYHYIQQYKMIYGVYNLREGGSTGPYGHKRNDMVGDNNPAKQPNVRKKISDALKGTKRPDLTEYNKKRYGKSYKEMYGEKRAKDIQNEMSKNRKGRKISPRTKEHCKKLSKTKQKYVYEMISPDGDMIIHSNMTSFAKKYNLNRSSLMYLVNGKNRSGVHKGWRGRIVNLI